MKKKNSRQVLNYTCYTCRNEVDDVKFVPRLITCYGCVLGFFTAWNLLCITGTTQQRCHSVYVFQNFRENDKLRGLVQLLSRGILKDVVNRSFIS